MSSLSEIIDLEHQINDRKKAVDAANNELKKARTEIKRAKESLEEASGKVTFHTANLRHMKTKADIVNLEEFIKTKQHLKDAKDHVDEAKVDLAKATSKEDELSKRIESYNKDIKVTQASLKAYGQLVPFKSDP